MNNLKMYMYDVLKDQYNQVHQHEYHKQEECSK